MLVGGDSRESGIYRDSHELLRDGVLASEGVVEIGLAGYPEGHPFHGDGLSLLAEKVNLASDQGLDASVVTQFSFAPERVAAFARESEERLPRVPLHIGIAGPTDPVALLRYAKRCGVDASRRAARHLGLGAARLAFHTDPSEQLDELARLCDERPHHSVAGAHFFGFGGLLRTARFMDGVARASQ